MGALEIFELSFWQWIVLIQHELLLFACIFFLIGALDDFIVDFAWLWLWLRAGGRARTQRITRTDWAVAPLKGGAEVFIPTWQQASVIGATIRHMLAAWPQCELRLYVGCYRNDADTIAGVMQAAQGDSRLRLVIHDHDGPSTKADCLNRLYRALVAYVRSLRGMVDFRPAAFVTSELAPLTLPLRMRAEAYVQAGHVGGENATGFADGQVHVLRDVGQFDLGQVSIGVGAWDGAQEGAERIDIGHSLRFDVKLDKVPARLALEYRERVASNAEPPSGAALTLSTRF